MGDKLFDYCTGNPPYQEPSEKTSDKPVYNIFMDATYEVAEKVELITPARFLFDAGKTPKAWNDKMLADEHLKVLQYEPDARKLFPNTDIKGGTAITYRDAEMEFGAIEIFSPYEELQSILRKVKPTLTGGNLSSIIYLQNKWDLQALYADHPDYKNIIGSDGREKRLTTSIFTTIDAFSETRAKDSDVEIIGLIDNVRCRRYVSGKYIDNSQENYEHFKVIVPKSNGCGAIGEELSTPLIGTPLIGYTQSFLGIGSFDTRDEAETCMKYIKGKFARTMLGILKITQDNPPEKWRYVPLQDFTSASDIDWSKTIPEIDRQLYSKYRLSLEEIEFIESHVKAME